MIVATEKEVDKLCSESDGKDVVGSELHNGNGISEEEEMVVLEVSGLADKEGVDGVEVVEASGLADKEGGKGVEGELWVKELLGDWGEGVGRGAGQGRW